MRYGLRFLNHAEELKQMGLLVGNTTVIEHAGTYVEYSRTYQHVKYSPEKVSIGFILPKGIPLSDGMLLARGIVHAQLGLHVENPKKTNRLCKMVFDQSLSDFDREPVEEYEPPKPKRKKRFEDLIEEANDGDYESALEGYPDKY